MSNLTKNEDGSWSASPVEMNIAQALLNATFPIPSFETMFTRYMGETTNMIAMNRNLEKKIAFFRYADGSTVHLDNLSSRWTAPCSDCVDARKCMCDVDKEISYEIN